MVYKENRGEGFGVWREPFTNLRVPLVFNLRRDPYERAQHNANVYEDWALDRVFIIAGANAAAMQFLMTMKEFPPSQRPGLVQSGHGHEAGARKVGRSER